MAKSNKDLNWFNMYNMTHKNKISEVEYIKRVNKSYEQYKEQRKKVSNYGERSMEPAMSYDDYQAVYVSGLAANPKASIAREVARSDISFKASEARAAKKKVNEYLTGFEKNKAKRIEEASGVWTEHYGTQEEFEDILSQIEETEQKGFDWKTKTRLEFWNYAFVISGGDWGGARDIYDSGVR